MKKLYNTFKMLFVKLGYINNPIGYIEDSIRTIEQIQYPSIFFINMTMKLHGNSITIEDRVDFYKSSGHRYLIYTITTKSKDKVLLRVKIKDGKVNISYDKITKNIRKEYCNVPTIGFKFGGTIDIYDQYANKGLIRFLVCTLYKTNQYISTKLDKK